MDIRVFIENLHIDKTDLEFIIDKIFVYEDHIHIKLKDDITCILESGTLPEESTEEAANFKNGVINNLNTKIVQTSNRRSDKVYGVSVISNGDDSYIATVSSGSSSETRSQEQKQENYSNTSSKSTANTSSKAVSSKTENTSSVQSAPSSVSPVETREILD
ncbi:MAG: hypothetical protein KBS41_02735 [Oscillospiraceae bacterium]|nr:hypothetical protein [Candidatus Equicaccousia limihippi]